MGGNDGEIYKTTTACADETGIEIVKVREKDVEGRCYQEAYMHAFLWCSKNFAPELLLVGESEHNIYICMKRMEKTLCDWIPTRKVGMIADVLIKFFQTLDSLHKEYGFVLGTIQRNKTTVATHPIGSHVALRRMHQPNGRLYGTKHAHPRGPKISQKKFSEVVRNLSITK